MTVSRENIADWRGRDLASADGSKLGRIEEIYLDAETNEPEFALIHTGLFGTKQTFVPLRDASPADDQLQVPYDKAQVKDAPSIEPDGKMSETEEAELYRHYGLGYSEARSGSGLADGSAGRNRFTRDDAGAPPVSEDTSGPETDNAMTRSEEELHVGKAERESGRVRLDKDVEVDERTVSEDVRREQIEVDDDAPRRDR